VFYRDHLRAAVFRLAGDVDLEACLEAVLVAALAVTVLPSEDFLLLDAEVLEAGFFPVTSFLAVSRREEAVVFFVVAVLVVDFEEGFKVFLGETFALVFCFTLEDVFTGLTATLGSLTSFFTVAFLVVSLTSLAAGFFATDFVALVAVVLDLDLEADLAGAFFVLVVLDAFAGLFSLAPVSPFLATVFGGSLTRPERPLGR